MSTSGPTPAQLAKLYNDPAFATAHELLIRGESTTPARAARRQSPQVRAALAGRQVHALPTRAARRAKRKARKMLHRAALAGAAGFAFLLVLLTFMPVSAAVGVSLAVAFLTLTATK